MIDISLAKQYALELETILAAEDSLHEFTRQAWHVIEGGRAFVDNWHIGAICEHLEAITSGQIRNLIINIPPRTSKSSIISVLWPAWWFIKEPYKQFLCASHSASITDRDSLACRKVIKSPWYQRRWRDIVSIRKDQDNITKFATTANGFRATTSVGSKLIGQGGDVRIFDDLNDAQEAESDVIRNRTNDFYDNTSTRVNDFMTSIDVIVQQRTHAQDVSGHIIEGPSGKDYVQLILPMEFERKHKCFTVPLPSTNGKPWEDPRKEEGELLCPARIPKDELDKLKIRLRSPYRISGQLQQRPSPSEGGIIKGSWFAKWKYDAPPKSQQIIQSWDCALEANELNSYSACTTWGLFFDDNNNYNLILLSLWRGRVEYPDLRAMAQRLYNDYRDEGTVQIIPDGKHIPDMVLVESKASGHSLIHDLQRAGVLCVGFDPGQYGDKIKRVHLATPIIQAGRVWLPAKPPSYDIFRPFAQTLYDLSIIFPNSDARDVVDTMTQVLLRLIYSGFLKHPNDDKSAPGITKPKHGFYGSSG